MKVIVTESKIVIQAQKESWEQDLELIELWLKWDQGQAFFDSCTE